MLVILLVSMIGTGSYGYHLAYAALLHLVMGAITAALCYLNTRQARQQLLETKYAGKAAETS